MLKNIDPLLSPELLSPLRAMGRGDDRLQSTKIHAECIVGVSVWNRVTEGD